MEIQKDDKVRNFCLQKEIQWEFNPPYASNFGGAWERQIKSTRKILASLMRDEVLTDESLNTLFCEVEDIINGRPITPASDDPADLEALTPNHLLKFKPEHPMPVRDFTKQDIYRKRWRHVQYLAQEFWRRWVGEYLPTITFRPRDIEDRKEFKVGDMVLVLGGSMVRSRWPLGRIVKTYTSHDGLVRTVDVRTQTGTYKRPISCISFLEGIRS